MLWIFIFIYIFINREAVKPSETQPVHSSREAHSVAQGQRLWEDWGHQGSCDHTYGLFSLDGRVIAKFTFLNLPSRSSRFTALSFDSRDFFLMVTLSQHDGHIYSASVVRVIVSTYGINMH